MSSLVLPPNCPQSSCLRSESRCWSSTGGTTRAWSASSSSPPSTRRSRTSATCTLPWRRPAGCLTGSEPSALLTFCIIHPLSDITLWRKDKFRRMAKKIQVKDNMEENRRRPRGGGRKVQRTPLNVLSVLLSQRRRHANPCTATM